MLVQHWSKLSTCKVHFNVHMHKRDNIETRIITVMFSCNICPCLFHICRFKPIRLIRVTKRNISFYFYPCSWVSAVAFPIVGTYEQPWLIRKRRYLHSSSSWHYILCTVFLTDGLIVVLLLARQLFGFLNQPTNIIKYVIKRCPSIWSYICYLISNH